MITLITFDPSSGAINQTLEGLEDYLRVIAQDNQDALIHTAFVTSITHYVKLPEEEVLPKQPFDYTTTVDDLSYTITGLPAGIKVYFEDQFIITDDDPTEIEFDIPGTYTLELSGSVPHLDETIEVTING